MGLIDRKITSGDLVGHKVADRPDTLYNQAPVAKAWFDDVPINFLLPALNGAIDDLASVTPGASGAENIGVETIAGVTGNDAQTVLAAMVPKASIVNDLTTGGTDVPPSAETVKTLETNKVEKPTWDHTTFNIGSTADNLILKIGSGTASVAGTANTFGAAFPNALLAIFATVNAGSAMQPVTCNRDSKSQFTAYSAAIISITYLAIGY